MIHEQTQEQVHTLFQEKLHTLRQHYLQRLPEKIHHIDETWAMLCTQKDTETLQTFHRLVHSLAGSSGNYGLSDLSLAARVLATFVQELPLVAQAWFTDYHAYIIETLLERLKAAGTSVRATSMDSQQAEPGHSPCAIRETPAHDFYGKETDERTCHAPDPWLRLPDALAVGQPATLASPPATYAQTQGSAKDNRLIFLVEDDPDLGHDLALQIGHFGYHIRVFEHTDGLKDEVIRCQPAAIIMDVVFPEGNLAGVEVVAEIQQSSNEPIPVMFISIRDDVSARLQAVRAGGRAYFPKPINIPSLIDKLDALTHHQEPEPYRILIIDDDPAMSDYYQMVLEQDGMLTSIVNNPLDFMLPLVEFQPDLILMDLYMPACTGLEMASVLRQQEAYVGIPIVYLSTETNVEKQLEAMHQGGDDFLTKTIPVHHLIATVRNRARRARVLRSSMIRDSLTGLLNHTTLKENLHREVAYAHRRHAPLAFAMIDIDCFKSINDTYGHTTGDRVLKSLSRVLQQRLRKTDIIGRYGGEEFSVMLPDTSGANAFRVLDEIREDFSHIRQRTADTEFSVTFSCGIADFPTYSDANTLNKVADEALYQAKRGGRNRVVLV